MQSDSDYNSNSDKLLLRYRRRRTRQSSISSIVIILIVLTAFRNYRYNDFIPNIIIQLKQTQSSSSSSSSSSSEHGLVRIIVKRENTFDDNAQIINSMGGTSSSSTNHINININNNNNNNNVQLTIDNIIWSRNYYRYANYCTDNIPKSYYTLEIKPKNCNHPCPTECRTKPEEMIKWFTNCNTRTNNNTIIIKDNNNSTNSIVSNNDSTSNNNSNNIKTIWIRSQTSKAFYDIQYTDLTTFIDNVLPILNEPFNLITTDGDNGNPENVPNANKLLQNSLLNKWYMQNYNPNHIQQLSYPDKMYPIPIGLDLHTLYKWSNDKIKINKHELLNRMIKIRERMIKDEMDMDINNPYSRRINNDINNSRELLYIPPMSSFTGIKSLQRTKIKFSILYECRKHNITTIKVDRRRISLQTLYAERYIKYKFGISPRGNGLDCHRTWEMLFFGMIPIVKTSILDPLYDGLPVLIVNNWYDICQPNFLQTKYNELKHLIPINNEKLTMDYYINTRWEEEEKINKMK